MSYRTYRLISRDISHYISLCYRIYSPIYLAPLTCITSPTPTGIHTHSAYPQAHTPPTFIHTWPTFTHIHTAYLYTHATYHYTHLAYLHTHTPPTFIQTWHTFTHAHSLPLHTHTSLTFTHTPLTFTHTRRLHSHTSRLHSRTHVRFIFYFELLPNLVESLSIYRSYLWPSINVVRRGFYWPYHAHTHVNIESGVVERFSLTLKWPAVTSSPASCNHPGLLWLTFNKLNHLSPAFKATPIL